MFDATRLLGSFLQNQSGSSVANRLSSGLSQGGAGGTLGQLFSRFGGSQGGGLSGLMGALSGSGQGGRGGDDGRGERFAAMARQAVASPGQELQRNNPLAVGGLGALAGTLLGGGRGAVGGGLLAVIGSLAYSALQAAGQSTPEASATGTAMPGNATPGAAAFGAAAPGAFGAASPGAFGAASPGAGQGGYSRPQAARAMPELAEADVQRTATLVLRSMIQAAKADGQIDGGEIERITGKLDEGGDAAEARSFVLDQMRGPADLDGLVAEARTPLEAAEIYGAALMAIEVDTEAERDYLARLAAGLRLPQPTVAHLHGSLGLPVPAA